MKLIFFLIFTFSSSILFAQANLNECTKNLLKLNDWSELSDPVLLCLNSNVVFTNTLQELCQNDRQQLSTEFQQYLKYKKEYEDAFAWYQTLSQQEQQTNTAKNKLKLAKEKWESLGLKNHFNVIKYKFYESYRSCNPILD